MYDSLVVELNHHLLHAHFFEFMDFSDAAKRLMNLVDLKITSVDEKHFVRIPKVAKILEERCTLSIS